MFILSSVVSFEQSIANFIMDNIQSNLAVKWPSPLYSRGARIYGTLARTPKVIKKKKKKSSFNIQIKNLYNNTLVPYESVPRAKTPFPNQLLSLNPSVISSSSKYDILLYVAKERLDRRGRRHGQWIDAFSTIMSMNTMITWVICLIDTLIIIIVIYINFTITMI